MKEYIETAKIKPIVDDFGDGYYIFCPECRTCIGRGTEKPKICEECGAVIDWGETNEN